MTKTRLGKRMVDFQKGIFTTTIGGKQYSTKSWEDLKRKIAVYESGASVRSGKRALAKIRGENGKS